MSLNLWQKFFETDERQLRAKDAIECALKSIERRFGLNAAYISRSQEDHVLVRFGSGKTQLLPKGAAFKDTLTMCRGVLSNGIAALPNPHNPKSDRLVGRRGTSSHMSVPVRLDDGSVHGLLCVEEPQDQLLRSVQQRAIEGLCDLLALQIQVEAEASGKVSRLSDRVRDLIEQHRLRIVYQPIFSLASREIIGFEVLSRFPDDGRRSTADWFSEAKAVGLGSALELEAISLALKDLSLFPSNIYIALNASPELLLKEEIHQELQGAIGRRIVVEVTENDIVHDYEKLQRALQKIRPDVRIAVDDTGAGHSSFRHILDLKPDNIKLDAALTRNIDTDRERIALGGAIVSFAHALDMTVVAEGVESEAIAQTLQDLGIDAAQGFHLGQPVGVVNALKAARKTEMTS